MRVWLGTMGLSIGGQTYNAVAEQAKRISNCRLQFFASKGEKEVMRHGGFVDGSITMAGMNSDQPALWNDRVLLNEEFYRALREHPVPVSEAGLRAIGLRSMVIDVYIWLAYRLRSLKDPTSVSWLSLHGQFGAGFQLLRKFRAHFIECLELAMAAYPEARVEIGGGRRHSEAIAACHRKAVVWSLVPPLGRRPQEFKLKQVACINRNAIVTT